MTPSEAVSSVILNQFGIRPRDGWRAALKRAADDLERTTNLSADTLLTRATTDMTLLKLIVGRVTVPESFFFRQPEQLELIKTFISKQLLEVPPGSEVRIWSAGCSSGEEPLSLAMLLKESVLASDLKRISIIGNDINAEIIANAKTGLYTQWSFRGISEERRLAYFVKVGEGRYQLNQDILEMVNFEHRSIQEQLSLFWPDTIDVVMFRNVGIYLTNECLSALFAGFAIALKEGGLLCMAPSDPPVTHPDLEKVDSDFGIVYRKRTGAHRREVVEWSPAPPVIPPKRSPVPDRAKRVEPKRIEPDKGTPNMRPSSPPTVLSNHDYVTNGQTALDAQDPDSAEVNFRKALFSNPIDPEARFWYALALFEANSHNRSRAQLNALLASLKETDPSQILSDGRSTVGELVQNARSLLEKVNRQYGD